MSEVVAHPHTDQGIVRRHVLKRLAREAVVTAVMRHLQDLHTREPRSVGGAAQRNLLGVTAKHGIESPTRHVEEHARVVGAKLLACDISGRPQHGHDGAPEAPAVTGLERPRVIRPTERLRVDRREAGPSDLRHLGQPTRSAGVIVV
ncbi:MAG: hypothetical protein VB139_09655, partial [Coriobacteriia bacterium]|nr:hypothetical protein [Coriobacteriia bacterium]